jgi:hypothetical protein
MALSSKDLLGQAVYTRDLRMLGRIKQVVDQEEYAVVGRFPRVRIMVPVRLIDSSSDRLRLPFKLSFFDNAPKIDSKRPLSQQDRSVLQQFYAPRAA